MTTNHRLLLAARPAGIPGPVNFTADAVPVRTPGPGEALLETLYLSIDYPERYDEARTWLAARRRDGSLRQRLHVLEGLAQAPIGLGMLFRGENTGKLVVRVAAG